jgi:hypothetical protein
MKANVKSVRDLITKMSYTYLLYSEKSVWRLTAKQARTVLFIFLPALFIVIVSYYWGVTSVDLPVVFQDDGEYFTRDSGMLIAYLDFWHSNGLIDFLHKLRLLFDYGMVQDDAPLQFWFNNLYVSLIVRNTLPLVPGVILFPKAVIGAVGGLYAFLLCRKLFSARLGVVFALAYCLAPWYAGAIRFSTLYPQLISLLHLVVLYHYTDYIKNPIRPLFRILAPLSLAVYMTAGLDWPFFAFVLIAYLVLNRRFRAALYNWYNLIPLLVLLSHVYFTIRISGFVSGWEYGLGRWKKLFLTYPFSKLYAHGQEYEFSCYRAIKYFNMIYGFGWYLAVCAAIAIALFYMVKIIKARQSISSPSCHFTLLIALWLLLLILPFAKTGCVHVTYGFVMAVPMMFLASIVVDRLKLPYVIAFLLYVGYLQWSSCMGIMNLNVSDNRSIVSVEEQAEAIHTEDQRLLAVSAFLIENRPDLLAKDKRALLPYYQNKKSANAYFVKYYVMGDYTAVRPWLAGAQKNGIPTELLGFMNSQREKTGNDILDYVDWVVMPSEVVTDKIPWKDPLDDYYIRLLDDPRVNWIGQFRYVEGREIYLGEVNAGNPENNTSLEDAQLYSVNSLANIYQKKYNYLRYLKAGVGERMYYW